MGPAPFDLSRKVLIVIVLIIAALETDHQAALFRIEAAQCGGGTVCGRRADLPWLEHYRGEYL